MVSIRCIPDQLSNITYKFPSSKVLYGLYENLKKIQECKQVCIFEGEKSVLKSKTLFGENDISVASFGCNLSQYHLELLKSLGVNTLMFCYDRETEERILKKMEKVYKRSSLLFDVYYIKDYGDLIGEKESPIDRGEKVYRELLSRMEEYKINN